MDHRNKDLMEVNMSLTKTLDSIARSGKRLETQAGGLLAHVRENDITTLDQWLEAVKEAYAAKGWHTGRGRPRSGTKSKPIPHVVKTYVSEVSAAYKLGVDPRECSTWNDLRRALKDVRAKLREDEQEEHHLQGVRVSKDGQLLGALWHDAIVVYENLPDDDREEMERQIKRIMDKYQGKVQLSLAA